MQSKEWCSNVLSLVMRICPFAVTGSGDWLWIDVGAVNFGLHFVLL